jgi:hypothetical protein
VVRLVTPLLLRLQEILDCRSLRHSINPCLHIREVLRLIILNDLDNARLPSEERKISKGLLATDKVFMSCENA